MDPVSEDDLAIRSAALPFVVSWKDIDYDAEVLSLDADQHGWDVLLAGQEIQLRTSADASQDQWSVITRFDACDVVATDDFKAWAAKLLQSLKPGGLLIVGGSLPANASNFNQLYPETVAQILRDAGFTRASALSPSIEPGNKSLQSALYATSRKFAIIAQKHAVGKKFDVFSPNFLQLCALSPQSRFKRAEEELHTRIHAGETELNKRITHIDSVLFERTKALEKVLIEHVSKSQIILDRRADEIAHLHNEIQALQAKLKRATRRRGLRKLAYEIRKKLRPKPKTMTPSETTPQVKPHKKLEAAVQEVQFTEELARSTAKNTPASVDPVPLSPHEITLRHRLFEQQET